MPHDDTEHNAAWKALGAPLREVEPYDPDSARRTFAALHAGAMPVSWWRDTRLQLAVAAIIIVALTLWSFQRRGSAVSPEATGQRFALLLVEDSTFGAGMISQDSLVREYSEWARGLAERGALVLGEELADDQMLLGGATAASARETTQISGLFVIVAADREAAATIARSCPHLKYGGGIVLRPITPT
jgi:hypothetical protein